MNKLIPIICIVLSVYYLWQTNFFQLPNPMPHEVTTTSDSPNIPFQEMTIPFLRTRQYSSELGPLNKYRENSSYTSYLTSYNSDGLTINGLLTIPNGNKPDLGWPAIVFVHGYIAPSIYKTTEKYEDYVDYLASEGFVVFKIDLRGHGESGGEAGGAYYSSDYVTDTLNAYTALRTSSFVHPKSVGLWGHSMAGNVTFRSFVIAQDIPAIVIWAGATYSYEDLLKYGLNDNSYRPPNNQTKLQNRRNQFRETHGDFNKESEFWRQVVPTNYLEGVKGSVQLHHSVDDIVVNIGYSRDLVAILDHTPISHELYEYPNGGHNISGSAFSEAMERTVLFYKDKLQ